MEFLKELWAFIKIRKNYWMIPLILILLIFGTLILFSGSSALAPFIYSLF